MKVTVLGDSHISALKRAFDQLRTEGAWPEGLDFKFAGTAATSWQSDYYIDHGDRLELTERLFQRLFEFKTLKQGQSLQNVFGLNLFYHSAPVWRSNQWLRFRPMNADGVGQRLSSNVLECIILDDQSHNLALAAALRRMGVGVFAIESPRPFRAHRSIAKVGLQPEIVSAVDAIYRSTMRSALDALSIPTLPIPAQCVEPDGFMKPEFKSETTEDQHHANTAFGLLVLQRMVPFVLEHFAGKS